MYKKSNDFSKMIAVTNRHLSPDDPLERIRKIAERKPRAIILREKDLPEAEYREMAEKVLDICRKSGVPLFIHSHMETAGSLNCPYIHLSIPKLRTLLQTGENETGGSLSGRFREISVSCHSPEDIREAAEAGATQIILGNIFETDCKKGLPGKGLTFLEDAIRVSDVPVYAIGGITPDNLRDVLDAGAAGACMMSWWYRCPV